ncbi:GNAT family N-acetyltransferase [Thaumasiovibrio subtropicus]|uniref:GNAT family N-acetyltransferase n=1 Tax=Thaumasiovibrio subtropicus TaxID=1891207 RepID=UPI000B35AE88|nr:GNAT family N-acetyltransferase [Thaumasiovibrio subtropicus]
MVEIKGPQRGLGKACEAVLRTLPEWFGREDSLLEYVDDIEALDTVTAWQDGELIGFMSIKQHFDESAELFVLGVTRDHHRKGVGQALYQAVEAYLKAKNTQLVQVKTVSPTTGNADYAQTLAYYLAMGFLPLEDFVELWGEDTPCRILVKWLK